MYLPSHSLHVSIKGFLAILLASMLLVAGLAALVVLIQGVDTRSVLTSFRSKSDLLVYLEGYRGDSERGFGDYGILTGLAAAEGATDFSGTNVQVQGIDELDRVKTDGEFVYISAPSSVTIIRAFPPDEMAVAYVILIGELVGNDLGAQVEGLFVLQDRLIVVSSTTPYAVRGMAPLDVLVWEPAASKTVVSVLATDPDSEPSLVHSFEISGAYTASRMTSDTVYIVATEYVDWEEISRTPSYCVDSGCWDVEPRDIYYDPAADAATTYVNIMAIDPLDGESSPISVIAGYASTVYMSPENLYITYATGFRQMVMAAPWGSSAPDDGPSTSIFRVGVDGLDLWVAAAGSVPGTLLNQFSLDERASNLRVVTTTFSSGQINNVYVLNETLDVVGALEGLAPGEHVYSARFVGDALYLVTFKKVDPFFVIDLSSPTSPEVLGYLKIPGFSQYLHPVGDGLVLGVGKDTVQAEEGDFAWYQGLKLSLFDVNDVENPVEVAKYNIGDRGTESPVLWDHKAFLPMLGRGLFALPVDLREVDESKYPYGVPPNAYGEYVWQGLYVMAFGPDGFSIHGTVTHAADDMGPYEHDRWIWRSLYIGDYLYTVSDTMLKANNIADMEPVNDVIYGTE